MSKTKLDKQTIQKIKDTILQNKKVGSIILFGSRAKGIATNGSDIDLALVGDLSFKDLCEIDSKLDELNLPYEIDLVIYNKISNNNLKKHIDRVGINLLTF